MPPLPPSPGVLHVGEIAIGDGGLVLIAGPCVLESLDATRRIAASLAEARARLGLSLVFKASFDKANRTSVGAFRGPGLERGLAMLAAVADEFGLPTTTDIHQPEQAALAAEVVDLLQIPAFLCRQTDLLLAAAATSRPVSVKKGQFLAPGAMRHVVDKLRAGGANGVLVVERGTCFGHGDLVVDFRGLPGMRALGVPVCFDATHSSQHPPTDEGRTLGSRAHIRPLARAAVAVGADALFVEVHPDPEGAPSDASNMLPLGEFEAFAREMLQLRRALGSLDPREIAG